MLPATTPPPPPPPINIYLYIYGGGGGGVMVRASKPHNNLLLTNSWHAITYSVWYQVNNSGNNYLLAGYSGTTPVFYISIPNSLQIITQLSLGAYTNVAGITDYISSQAVGTWIHVAVTWSSATNTARLYVNGVLVGTADTTGYNVLYSGQLDSIVFGQISATAAWRPIDDFRLYDYALTQAQIAWDMANPAGPIKTACIKPPTSPMASMNSGTTILQMLMQGLSELAEQRWPEWDKLGAGLPRNCHQATGCR